MQKNILICIIILISNLLHQSLAQIPTVDHFILNKNISLVHLDNERILRNQSLWAEQFTEYQSNKMLLYSGVGILAIGCAIGVWYIWEHTNNNQNLRNISASTINQSDIQAAWWLKYFQEEEERKTIKGRVKWIVDNAITMTLYSLAAGFIARLLNVSWSNILKQWNSLAGSSDQDLFTATIKDLFINLQRMRASFQVLEELSREKHSQAFIENKLCLQLLRDIVIDHVALINSCEQCIAVIRELSKHLSPHIGPEITNIETVLYALIDTMVMWEQEALQRLFFNNDPDRLREFISMMQGFYYEFSRHLYDIGTMVYGVDFVSA